MAGKLWVPFYYPRFDTVTEIEERQVLVFLMIMLRLGPGERESWADTLVFSATFQLMFVFTDSEPRCYAMEIVRY